MSGASQQMDVPITWEAAETALKISEERFESGDVDGLVSRYADNVVIRFASLPEIRGREKARAWLKKRLQKQENYKLKKVLVGIDGQKVFRTWTAHWTDAATKQRMEGRGIEILEYSGGYLMLWDACFHVWEQGKVHEREYFDPA